MNLFSHCNSNSFLWSNFQTSSSAFKNFTAGLLFLSLFLFIGTSHATAETTSIIYDTCDDVTNGGTVSGNQTGCNDPIFDPAIIASTSPATGGSGILEYLWMSTTDDPNGMSAIWNIIPGSSGASYDPGPITETTYYRRCAKRDGCSIWIQESNTVTIEVQCQAPCDLEILNIVGVNPMCNPGNTGIVALSITGGTAPYTYTWSNGATTEDISDLTEGLYCVTITDANNCVVNDCVTLVAPTPLTETVQIVQSTCGNQSGSIDLSVSGGTGPYTYAWNNGATSQDLSNLAAGTYCVVITDSNNCELNACYVINESNNNTVLITPSTSTICPGETITLTANGTGSYSWSATAGNLSSNTGQSVSYTMGMPGTYVITVQATDASGCVATGTATVTVITPPTIGGNSNNATCGESNGAITTSTSNGTAPYTYTWSNGATTPNLNNLGAGQYCVTVADANGCTSNECFNVQETGANTVTISGQGNVCPGEPITLTASGNASYTWSASAGNLSSNAGQSVVYTMGMPGTYTITVQATDANGCIATTATTVTVYSALAIGGNATDATCGQTNGSITTSTSNGTAPYTYTWSNGASTPDLYNLGAGQYCVTVADANGCTSSECFNVQETGANTVTISGQGNICPGESVTLTASGNASYTWSASAGNLSSNAGQSVDYTMGMPGTYTVTVQATDANGCIAIASTTVTVYASPTIGGTASPTTCGESNGSVTTELGTNPALPITYTWSNGATTADLANLSAGQYCVTITNANGCTAQNCYTVSDIVSNNAIITPDQSNICPGGFVTLTASGSLLTTAYEWTASAGNLSNTNTQSVEYTMGMPGTYTITAQTTDTNGCTALATATVTVNTPPAIVGNATNATCGESNGAITTSASAGVAPYTYAWNNNATSANLSNLAAGQYCVTVTDANGCADSNCFSVGEIGANPVSITPGQATACLGNPVAFTASAGFSSYTWSTSAGNLSSNSGQSITYSNSNPGTHTVSVLATDANGCVATATASILVNSSFEVLFVAVEDATCGENNGSLTPGLTGGISPLSYVWEDGSTVANRSNLAPGQYCVTVTDANGCTASKCSVIVGTSSPTLTLLPTNPGCNTLGSVNTSVTGGALPYSYSWNTGQSGPSISGLQGGNFCVTLVDANGCQTVECVTLIENSAPTLGVPTIENVCSTSSDGSITTSVADGIAPYTYTWSTGANTANLINLSAGEYCVTVTDSGNCTATACYNVTTYQAPVITGTTQNPTCNTNTGSITNVVSNPSLYSFVWSNGATTSTIQNLEAGTYTVTVTSQFGCTSTATYVLVNEGSLSVLLDSMNPICAGSDNGMVTALSTYSGSGSLVYSWNTGATTSKISDLAAGDYCVTVTSSDGCQDSACTTLTAPTAFSADAIIGSAACNASNGNIKLNLIGGGVAPLTYKWSNGATTKDIQDLAVGTYCVTICDAVGCTFTDCFDVNGGVNFTTSIAKTDALCSGSNGGSASVNTNGGTSPFTYLWSTGATTSSINNLIAGNYCVTVTDIFGCSSPSCVDILELDPVDITTIANDTSCDQDNGTASVSSPSPIASIIWSNGATTSSINNLAAGTYSVTITTTIGCTAVSAVTVSPSADIEVSVSPSNTTVCPGEAVILTSSITQNAGITYSWTTTGGNLSSTTSNTTSFTMMAAGTYTVTLQAQNANGCIDTDQATIIVLGANDPICNPNPDLVNIGDYVWSDINNNGIQDPNELGFGGIEVKLLTAGPDGIFYTADDLMVATQITDASGFYLFEDVAAGDYVIMFCLNIPGTEYTSQNTGGNDMLDSDANVNTGKTDPFTVVEGQVDDLSFDAGIILTPTGCDNYTDGGEICCDQIVCGPGSIPNLLSNITLPTGGSGAVEYIWMYSNLSNVFNMDTWTVIPGANSPDYQPGSITQTTFITRCVRRAGCTTYRESNIIELEFKTLPIATIESLPAFICAGESDNFNATSAGFSVTYDWDLGAGANPATATGQHLTDVTWSTPGTKTITLTTTNLFCTTTHTRTVEVGSCIQPRFVNIAAAAEPETFNVEVNWETNSDMDDYKFLVEHSVDGDEYKIIYTMDGNTALDVKTYTYKDESARPGRNYYRIKHISNDGSTESSDYVMAIIDDFQADKFIMFPNPTQDYVIFESLKLTDKEGSIMISNMQGTILQEVIIPANTTRKMIDISNYPPGNYTFYIKYHNVRGVPTIINKMER